MPARITSQHMPYRALVPPGGPVGAPDPRVSVRARTSTSPSATHRLVGGGQVLVQRRVLALSCTEEGEGRRSTATLTLRFVESSRRDRVAELQPLGAQPQAGR
eukprot:scaffold93768_cov61-Phaeocystis_antarctica.AAC.2